MPRLTDADLSSLSDRLSPYLADDREDWIKARTVMALVEEVRENRERQATAEGSLAALIVEFEKMIDRRVKEQLTERTGRDG